MARTIYKVGVIIVLGLFASYVIGDDQSAQTEEDAKLKINKLIDAKRKQERNISSITPKYSSETKPGGSGLIIGLSLASVIWVVAFAPLAYLALKEIRARLFRLLALISSLFWLPGMVLMFYGFLLGLAGIAGHSSDPEGKLI